MDQVDIALAEEIGNTRFFTGRKQELKFYLDWAEGTKGLFSKSQALLSRRKMGKTALVQRLFNILYANNDPQIVPFFFRVPERPLLAGDFGLMFYRAFLSQYLGFRLRDPDLVNRVIGLDAIKELAKDEHPVLQDIRDMESSMASSPTLAWDHAQAAPHRLAKQQNIRIIQIIDEFQYLNRFIYDDRRPETRIDLCHTYMGMAESKYAPLIVTGSYIGWLTTILNHMTSRFEEKRLGPLAPSEALEAVYNYARIIKREVNETTAGYIAEKAYNDPFYISQIVRTQHPNPNLTSTAGVRDVLQFETSLGQGFTAKVWMEYIAEGLDRVNDVNGKKIVMYLARYGDEERTRTQIMEDLNLEVTDGELADRLYMLKQADLIAPGASDFRFKGLGDPIFEVIFRKRFAEEIENTPPSQVAEEFDAAMKRAEGKASRFRGMAGEFRVMFYLMSAVNKGANPSDILYNPTAGFTLDGFVDMEKKTFHWDHEKSTIVDIYAECQSPEGMDLVAEVKSWEKHVSNEVVNAFIRLKDQLASKLERPTAFLFYSENGFTSNQMGRMEQAGVMYTTLEKLTSLHQ